MANSVTLPEPFPEKALIARAIAVIPGAPRWIDLATAIQDIRLDTQIMGASFLTITVVDPDFQLQSAGAFSPSADGLLPAVDIEYPSGSGSWWRLSMIEGTGDRSSASFTITFEDRIVSYLQDKWGAKKAAAGTSTRAQFIQALVNEVGHGDGAKPITFVCPSLNVLQPVASSSTGAGGTTVATGTQTVVASTRKNKQRGIALGAAVTVKELPATQQQRADITTALQVAHSLRAPLLAIQALICAGIGESGFDRNAVDSVYGTHKGVWQSDVIPGYQVAAQAQAFLEGGSSFQSGGAIALSRTVSDPGQIATEVEAGGQPASFYSAYLPEAKRIIAAGGMAGGVTSSATSTSDVGELTRGTNSNPDESSWDCITRLAQQVQWYAFSNSNTLYYMSGDDMVSQMPAAYIDRVKDQNVIASFDYCFDNTSFLYQSTHKVKGRLHRASRIAKPQTPSEVRLHLVCEIDAYRAGDVFVLRNFGPPDATRWVVTDATRNCLSDTFTQFTLEPPTAPYPEPAASGTSTATPLPAATDSSSAADQAHAATAATAANASGSFTDPGQAALAAVAQKTKYVYRETRPMPGSLFDPAPRVMDCSAFVILAYRAAGFPDPSGNGYNGTGNTASMFPNFVKIPESETQPGDVCFYGPGPTFTHVAVYVGNGQVASMGRQGDPSIVTPAAAAGGAPFQGFYRLKVTATPLGAPLTQDQATGLSSALSIGL